jgi:hypothetical protein
MSAFRGEHSLTNDPNLSDSRHSLLSEKYLIYFAWFEWPGTNLILSPIPRTIL